MISQENYIEYSLVLICFNLPLVHVRDFGESNKPLCSLGLGKGTFRVKFEPPASSILQTREARGLLHL
jgi:hypothetical protein